MEKKVIFFKMVWVTQHDIKMKLTPGSSGELFNS